MSEPVAISLSECSNEEAILALEKEYRHLTTHLNLLKQRHNAVAKELQQRRDVYLQSLPTDAPQPNTAESIAAFLPESQEKIKMTSLFRSNTSQVGLIASLFDKNKNKKLSKRYIDKNYGLRWSFRNLTFVSILVKKGDEDIYCSSLDELISISDDIPGDVQRQLRIVYDKANKYGLIQEGSKKKNLSYTWNPINKCDCDNIIPKCARNIFKTPQESDHFINKDKKGKCECCGANVKDEKTLRMAIDHWRAHSNYDIDDKLIAVLLCETCNNIHHNHDASVIAVKYKDNLKIITNWKNIELRIRKNGFPPNEEDIAMQKKNIEIITNYWKDELKHPLSENFWEGLF